MNKETKSKGLLIETWDVMCQWRVIVTWWSHLFQLKYCSRFFFQENRHHSRYQTLFQSHLSSESHGFKFTSVTSTSIRPFDRYLISSSHSLSRHSTEGGIKTELGYLLNTPIQKKRHLLWPPISPDFRPTLGVTSSPITSSTFTTWTQKELFNGSNGSY